MLTPPSRPQQTSPEPVIHKRCMMHCSKSIPIIWRLLLYGGGCRDVEVSGVGEYLIFQSPSGMLTPITAAADVHRMLTPLTGCWDVEVSGVGEYLIFQSPSGNHADTTITAAADVPRACDSRAVHPEVV